MVTWQAGIVYECVPCTQCRHQLGHASLTSYSPYCNLAVFVLYTVIVCYKKRALWRVCHYIMYCIRAHSERIYHRIWGATSAVYIWLYGHRIPRHHVKLEQGGHTSVLYSIWREGKAIFSCWMTPSHWSRSDMSFRQFMNWLYVQYNTTCCVSVYYSGMCIEWQFTQSMPLPTTIVNVACLNHSTKIFFCCRHAQQLTGFFMQLRIIVWCTLYLYLLFREKALHSFLACTPAQIIIHTHCWVLVPTTTHTHIWWSWLVVHVCLFFMSSCLEGHRLGLRLWWHA